MWNGFGPADEFARKNRILDEWCAKVGRDPKAVERTVLIDVDEIDQADAFLEAGAEHLILATHTSGGRPYDLAPLEVVERRLGLGPSRFPSFLAGYEADADALSFDELEKLISVLPPPDRRSTWVRAGTCPWRHRDRSRLWWSPGSRQGRFLSWLPLLRKGRIPRGSLLLPAAPFRRGAARGRRAGCGRSLCRRRIGSSQREPRWRAANQ